MTYNGDAWPLPDDAVSHPRSSGTFTRFLSRWVRDRNAMPLIEGLRKCSLIPAQILEAGTPQMRRKARIQVGCDADIVVFDYEALMDRATFNAMNRPADGMRHVLVNGEAVISDGNLQLHARPGRPVRRPVQ
jgi:N-acyl-D-glutamate deacylase